MRILILRTAANKMDAATYNLQEVGLAKALVRKGHICDVAYSCEREEEHIEKLDIGDGLSINIIWLKCRNIFGEGLFKNLEKYVENYDVIQIGGYVGFNSVKLNRKYPWKAVNYQGPYYNKENRKDNIKAMFYDRLLLPLSGKKQMKVATKSILATEYIHSKGIDNVVTLGVGLDVDKLEKNNADNGYDSDDLKFVESIAENKHNHKYLLYIGRIEDRRNVLFMLDVLKKVVTENSDIRLVMIGKGEKNYVDKVDEKIKELNLENYILRKDKISQSLVGRVYKACDLFLLPTKYEIFGMVMLESMYYGVPVVTSYNGGSSTVMNSDNGVIIKVFSDEIWKTEILNLISSDERIGKMSQEAIKTIEENYTWDALSDKFLEFYKAGLENSVRKNK